MTRILKIMMRVDEKGAIDKDKKHEWYKPILEITLSEDMTIAISNDNGVNFD